MLDDKLALLESIGVNLCETAFLLIKKYVQIQFEFINGFKMKSQFFNTPFKDILACWN